MRKFAGATRNGPNTLPRDASRPCKTRQAAPLFRPHEDSEVQGDEMLKTIRDAVLEARLQLVTYDLLVVVETRLHDLAAARQLGHFGEVGDDVRMNAAPDAEFQMRPESSLKRSCDGSLPAANVRPVEQQLGCCGLQVESEVRGVQGKVSRLLEATQEPSGPSLAVVKSLPGAGCAAVAQAVGRILRPPFFVRGGGGEFGGRDGRIGGVRVRCGLELVEVGAGCSPVAHLQARHSSPRRRALVQCQHASPAAKI